MEAIEQGHGGPEVLFANRKRRGRAHRMADALAATAVEPAFCATSHERRCAVRCGFAAWSCPASVDT